MCDLARDILSLSIVAEQLPGILVEDHARDLDRLVLRPSFGARSSQHHLLGLFPWEDILFKGERPQIHNFPLTWQGSFGDIPTNYCFRNCQKAIPKTVRNLF